jgi:fatty acid desaturase
VKQNETDWRTLSLLLIQHGVFWGNLALYWSAPLPLIAHILIATFAIHIAFTIWHEAVHNTVTASGWSNNVVGVLGMFLYMTPYFMQKWIHLEHHRYMNERKDPNLIYLDGSFWSLPLRYPRALRYAKQLLREDPRSSGEKIADMVTLGVLAAIWGLALWKGVFVDLLLLWLLPFVIAKLAMDWYINWLPHVGLPADRYRGTRIVDLGWLTPLVLMHNYHAIHHLWPNIPWHRYRSVFRERLDHLRENGVPIEYRAFSPRPHGLQLDRHEPA